jgi:DNA polymerase-3 subunit gamma/tau
MTEPAAYQVVARRYRPQRFDELVGQEHVARGLSGAIQSGRVGHAYLFCGARGTGKTSAARIFAKALECAAGPAAEPCNACDACRAIAAGQDVDVVEIDAASNRGIDEIRQLRQNVAVRPARGRYKIYIIDEVHMLTREAFNALLKTLEEPPAHVKFVLCTTEPDKLPITILSRCQRFDFTTVEPNAIARRLAQIVEAEGADVSAEALALIARRAAGSMRDSQSLLEQLLGAATGPVEVDEVHALIGTGREERVGAILAAIADRDAAAALAALDAALRGGADPGGVLEQLLAALRDCLLASVGCGAELLQGQAGLGIDCAALGPRLGTATVLAMLQILDHALGRMGSGGHADVVAEMAVVRLARLEDLDQLADLVAGLTAGTAVPAPAAGTGGGGSVAAPRPTRAAAPPREKKTAELTPSAAVGPDPAASADPVPAGEPLAVWNRAGGRLEGLAADFAATATGAAWRDADLEVEIPAAAAVSFLNRPEVAAAIATALADETGRPVRCRLVAASGGDPRTKGPHRDTAAPLRATPAVSQAELLRAATEHPLVAHARDLFDAAIRRVEQRPRVADPPPADVAASPATEAIEVAVAAEPEEEGDG